MGGEVTPPPPAGRGRARDSGSGVTMTSAPPGRSSSRHRATKARGSCDVLDQVGHDDRIEAARLEPGVLDSPFDASGGREIAGVLAAERESSTPVDPSHVRAPRPSADRGRTRCRAAVPVRCACRAGRASAGRSTATALLIEVVLVLGIGVTRGHVIRRRQLVRLDGPARQAGVQVSMDSHLVARRRQFACGGPPVLPRVTQLGRAAAQAAAMRRRLLARCCHSHRHQTRDCIVRPRGIRDRRGSSAVRRAAAPAAPNRDRAWLG